MTFSVDANIPQSEMLLKNPDRLLAAWQELLENNMHIHPPEAAIRLGVPESALVASRIGSGATRLKPDMAAILAPIENWGRVLCAFSNKCGVHMPLGSVKSAFDGTKVTLCGDHMTAEIDAGAVSDAYMFIDTDESHGTTRSLQFFDAFGSPIVKIFIFHKTRFAKLQIYLDAFLCRDQSRRVVTDLPETGKFKVEAASKDDFPPGVLSETTPREALSSLLKTSDRFEIEMIGDHARVVWRGVLGGVRIDAHMLHIHEPDIRSHLRFAAMTKLEISKGDVLHVLSEKRRLLRLNRRKK